MITDFFVIINFFTNHFYLKENQLIRKNGHKLVEFRQFILTQLFENRIDNSKFEYYNFVISNKKSIWRIQQ